MITLDDPTWKDLAAGYKVPYDASIPLSKLESGENVWNELWEELHHQGDVGEASYAAVPQLVRIAKEMPSRDWNFYSLISVIEIERHCRTNPPLPTWLIEDYKLAWSEIFKIAIEDLRHSDDALNFRSVIGAMALSKGYIDLGALLTTLDTSEIEEILDQNFGWSESYCAPDSESWK